MSDVQWCECDYGAADVVRSRCDGYNYCALLYVVCKRCLRCFLIAINTHWRFEIDYLRSFTVHISGFLRHERRLWLDDEKSIASHDNIIFERFKDLGERFTILIACIREIGQ